MNPKITNEVKEYNTFPTPILFLIFNRPKLTKQVFQEIKKIKPKELYIAADGPRKYKEDDKQKCDEARKIIKDIDWDCELKILFREKNLGCEKAVISAINWFFKNVEQGIILEDDCLPSQSFFFYCKELLSKYKTNEKIFNISGNLYKNRINSIKESYYFSKYFHCWGWATWASKWNNYFDPKMTNHLNTLNSKKIGNIFHLKIGEKLWIKIFRKAYNGNTKNDWAPIWTFNCYYNKGLTCLPKVNLIQNIGFGQDATHKTNSSTEEKKLTRQNIKLPLIHPKKIKINKKVDKCNNKVRFKINLKRKIGFFLRTIKLYNFVINLKK